MNRSKAKTRYIVSDMHLGAGDYLDDFDQDENFGSFLEAIGGRRGSELVLNGDFIDFAAVTLEEGSGRPFSRLGCTERESLAKLERVLEAHPSVFASLRRFVARDNRLVLVPGNHDIDLFWPLVRDRLADTLGNPDSEHFHFESSGIYRDSGLHIEHGNQYYAESVFENFTQPFLRDPKSGELRLERCWGNCFVEYFTNGLMSRRNPFVNNVRPISSLVFLGIQDESWWFKSACGYKLLRFVHHMGFPPFEEGREQLRRKRGGRENGEEYTRRRLVRVLSGRGQVELPGMEAVVEPQAEVPKEGEFGEHGQAGLHLDFLATREDALSVAARELLLSGEGIDVVVFGHDHRYYSNELSPVLEGKKGKYYINTGTWMPMLFLTRTRRKLRWRDLADESLYQRLLTYAMVKRGMSGQVASLRRIA